MEKRINNKGISLLELIVSISIMVILVGVIAPQMIKHVDRAKQVKVEKEASEFIKAAQVALVSVTANGQAPGADVIKNKTENSSPYYKGGKKYGNLTNWTVHNGVVAGASNGPFADELFGSLGIGYGKDWRTKSSRVPISTNQPKIKPAGSMTGDCIFQIFYDAEGNMFIEYSRSGYFVRMENSVIVESVKIRNETEKHFTSWQ